MSLICSHNIRIPCARAYLIIELICICATNTLKLEDCQRCRLLQQRPLLQPVCLATDTGQASALNAKNVRIKWSALCILRTGGNIKNLSEDENVRRKALKIVSTSGFEKEIRTFESLVEIIGWINSRCLLRHNTNVFWRYRKNQTEWLRSHATLRCESKKKYQSE